MLRICIYVDASTDLNQWAYVVLSFDPDEVYVCGEVPPEISTMRRAFGEAKIVANAGAIPGELVVVTPVNARELQGDTPLDTFIHPEDACYLFGADSSILAEDDLGRSAASKVFIPTATDDDFYAPIAGAIVLYDRRVKRG